MYERFTSRSRLVMQRADQAARGLEHEYLGTEHVLLGILDEPECVAAQVLIRLGVDLQKARLEVDNVVMAGPDMVSMSWGKRLWTPRAKEAVELALEESRNMGHDYVGTEHILLGLLEGHGFAGQVLRNLRVTAADVRLEIPQMLSRAPVPRNRFELGPGN
jgi:ATP-dependent Clp protease ATP-binding subunit ClpC